MQRKFEKVRQLGSPSCTGTRSSPRRGRRRRGYQMQLTVGLGRLGLAPDPFCAPTIRLSAFRRDKPMHSERACPAPKLGAAADLGAQLKGDAVTHRNPSTLRKRAARSLVPTPSSTESCDALLLYSAPSALAILFSRRNAWRGPRETSQSAERWKPFDLGESTHEGRKRSITTPSPDASRPQRCRTYRGCGVG